MNDAIHEQPPQFKVHNRTGSVNLTFTPARFDGETFTSQKGEVRVLKKGYLMIEMANAAGTGNDSRSQSVYDWANKVAMKLTDPDIHQILAGLDGAPCQIVHDPNKARGEGGEGTLAKSCLQVSKGERFGWFMTMSRGERKARCPLSESDAATLRLLLERAVVSIFGW